MLIVQLLLTMLVLPSFSFFKEKDKKLVIIYSLFIFLLVLFAGFRPYGIDNDSMNYLSLYHNPESELIEPSFFVLCKLVSTVFNDPRALFVIYALLSITLKGIAIHRLTELWFLSLMVWMSHYFLMQDMTQIRIAVSSAIFLLAVSFLAKGRRLIYIALTATAIFFHYSAIILLGFIFLTNKKLTKTTRLVMAILPVIALMSHFLHLDFIMLLPIPYIQNKINLYETMRDIGFGGDEINIFNIAMLSKIFIYYFLLFKHELIEKYNPYFPLLLKVYCVSICAFMALSFLPVLSYRVSEIIGVVDIILIPLIYYAIHPKYAGITLISIYAICIFLLNVFYNELLHVS